MHDPLRGRPLVDAAQNVHRQDIACGCPADLVSACDVPIATAKASTSVWRKKAAASSGSVTSLLLSSVPSKPCPSTSWSLAPVSSEPRQPISPLNRHTDRVRDLHHCGGDPGVVVVRCGRLASSSGAVHHLLAAKRVPPVGSRSRRSDPRAGARFGRLMGARTCTAGGPPRWAGASGLRSAASDRQRTRVRGRPGRPAA